MATLRHRLRNSHGCGAILNLETIGEVDIPLPDFNEGSNELAGMRERLALWSAGPCDALVDCFGQALGSLTREELARLRMRVAGYFGPQDQFVELIDGHVALREIQGVAH